MSVFSEYAAASEHNTAVNRHTPVRDLNNWSAGGALALVIPVSGDMLAVLSAGTREQRTRRRKLAIARMQA